MSRTKKYTDPIDRPLRQEREQLEAGQEAAQRAGLDWTTWVNLLIRRELERLERRTRAA